MSLSGQPARDPRQLPGRKVQEVEIKSIRKMLARAADTGHSAPAHRHALANLVERVAKPGFEG